MKKVRQKSNFWSEMHFGLQVLTNRNTLSLKAKKVWARWIRTHAVELQTNV